MSNAKLFDPETAFPTYSRRHGKIRPRCACGCGKAAYWPQAGEPVFHTRLCGYLMPLEAIRNGKLKRNK